MRDPSGDSRRPQGEPANATKRISDFALAMPARSTFFPWSRIASTISSASARARRPSSSGTTGVERSRTARRNDLSSACSGSSEATGGSVTPICGFTEGAAGRRPILTHGEDQHFLATVVERNILPRLKETQLAHPLGGNPAGREIRDAARFQLQTHVRNVHFSRQNRQADRANFLDRRLGKCQHDVEIVNHQIEHDIHIQRTRSKHAQPVHLEKHGLRQQRNRGAHRRIEALEVSDLGDLVCAWPRVQPTPPPQPELPPAAFRSARPLRPSSTRAPPGR